MLSPVCYAKSNPSNSNVKNQHYENMNRFLCFSLDNTRGVSARELLLIFPGGGCVRVILLLIAVSVIRVVIESNKEECIDLFVVKG